MSKPEHFGSEANGSKNEKYCYYCYKEGAFAMPYANLDQIFEISTKDWSDQDPNMSYEAAKGF